MNSICIVIPALNEEQGIGCTLDALPLSQLHQMGYSTQVVIVDGKSTDDTAEIARARGADVIVEPRKGYGRAYKTGFLGTQSDYIATMDADGSYPAEVIPVLLKNLVDKNLDLVTTSRLSNLQPGAMSASHLVGNKILNGLCRLLFRLNIQDSQSGMWIFKRSLLSRIGVESDGMAFSQEFKIRSFQRASCLEVPIEYRARLGQQKLSALFDGASNFKRMVGLLRNGITVPMIPATSQPTTGLGLPSPMTSKITKP